MLRQDVSLGKKGIIGEMMGKIGREKSIALVGFAWNINSALHPCSMSKFLGSSIGSGLSLSHGERTASSALSQSCKAPFNVNTCPGPPNLVAPISGVDKRMRRPEHSLCLMKSRASLSLISLHPHAVYCPGGRTQIRSRPSCPGQ